MRGQQEVHALRQRLEAAFQRARALSAVDFEVQSDFAKYLCVLVSGYLETSVSELAIEYCRNRAQTNVSNYASRELARLQNLKAERLLQVVGAFSADWRNEMERYIDGRRRDALNAVIDLRNKIAHGENVTLTYSRILSYDVAIQEIVEFVTAKFA
jgi:hypothetical protein